MLLFYFTCGHSEMSGQKSSKLILMNHFTNKYYLPRVAALINHPSVVRNSVIETDKIEGFDNR
jgi:hypothetical protein